MVERINFSSGSHWEPLRGFSRAVRVGDQLFISGTTALSKNGDVIGGNDAYGQTRYVLERVKEILQGAGFQLQDVIRTRLFVTRIASWDDFARAHRETFEQIRPASSILEVSRLVDPRLLVEVEVDAFLGSELARTVELATR